MIAIEAKGAKHILQLCIRADLSYALTGLAWTTADPSEEGHEEEEEEEKRAFTTALAASNFSWMKTHASRPKQVRISLTCKKCCPVHMNNLSTYGGALDVLTKTKLKATVRLIPTICSSIQGIIKRII